MQTKFVWKNQNFIHKQKADMIASYARRFAARIRRIPALNKVTCSLKPSSKNVPDANGQVPPHQSTLEGSKNTLT